MGGGIINDLPANQIPKNAWSDGNNVRFIRAHVEKISGHSEIFGTASASGTIGSLALGQARWLIQSETSAGAILWAYCDLDAIYATDGVTHYDISHSGTGSGSISFGASEDYSWNGGLLNRYVVMNSHAQAPRWWLPSTANKTKELSAWPASSMCRVLRTYKNYMVGIGWDEGAGGFNDQILRWSHPVDVGGNPTNASWDYTDTSLDSGRVEIDDGFGRLVDCMPLRDDNIVYAEHAIYRMSPIVTGDVFAFRRVFSEVGLLTRNCIATVRNRHVIIGDGDIYLHNGNSIESIVTKRWKQWFFSQIGTHWRRSFVVPNYKNNEIWFCFPVADAIYPNKALIWSFDDNNLTSRDLPITPFIGYGRVPSNDNDTFDGGSMISFDDETQLIFDQQPLETTEQDMVMAQFQSSSASSTQSLFFELDTGMRFDNDTYESYVEKDALILEPNGRFTQRNEYQVHAIRPRVSSSTGGSLGVRVGVRSALNDPITWMDSATFDMSSDAKVDVRATGNIITVRFENSEAEDWEIDGFSVDFDRVGAQR